MAQENDLQDIGAFILRLTTGGLLMGHGAQKLFGAFNGPGPEGMAGFMESLGLYPGKAWGMAGGAAEFGGGMLTALGLLSPLGPIGVMSAMSMAAGLVHWDKPIWAQEGGAELPVTNGAIALALAIAGPGKYSLDEALGIKVPCWAGIAAGLSAAGVVAYALATRTPPPPAPPPSGE